MARKPQTLFRIMPACPADLDEIMEIERLSFSNPWSRQVFVEEFDHDFSRVEVIRHDESHRMLAFINYWLVHDEIHVLNLAIHPSWRRRGLARKLMDHAIDTGVARGAQLVKLEVRRSNEAARTLYEQMGFRTVKVHHRYYENGEDAMVMVKELE